MKTNSENSEDVIYIPIDVGENNKGIWKETEHNKFLSSLLIYGKKWKLVRNYIGTRTVKQIKSHSQKYFSSVQRRLFKDYEKQKNNSDKISDLTQYSIKWIDHFIRTSVLPEITSIQHSEKNFNIKVFLKIFYKSLVKSKNVDLDKVSKKCCCTYGNRICDCIDNCCVENSTSQEFNLLQSPTFEEKMPIFKIEKTNSTINADSDRRSYNSNRILSYTPFAKESKDNKEMVSNNNIILQTNYEFDANSKILDLNKYTNDFDIFNSLDFDKQLQNNEGLFKSDSNLSLIDFSTYKF